MGRSVMVMAGVASIAMLAAGCAAKKDTRYLNSQQTAPLVVPAGLDTPAYTQTMAIPRVSAAGSAARDAAVERGGDLEAPPRRIEPPAASSPAAP